MSDTNKKLSRQDWITTTILRSFLVLVVLIELFIASRSVFARLDLTEDKLYSLTASSRRILGSLKDRLVIEAYFTRDSSLPGVLRDERQKIVDFLDEYKQLGGGNVQVVYFAPEEDKQVEERADRLGIQKLEMTVLQRDPMQTKVLDQGLRLLDAGRKQKIGANNQNALTLEPELTPKIKELVLDKKPKIGIFARAGEPNPMMRQMNPMG